MGRGEKRRGGGGGRGGGRGGGGKRAKYMGSSKGNSQALPIGSRGILATCHNGWEDRAANEVIAMLEEHYDKLAGSAAQEPAAAAGGKKDISALIAEEVAELKDRSKRKFQIHDTGVRGCVYIVFPNEPESPGPVEVVNAILAEAVATKSIRGRHVNRLLPITHACFAGKEEMTAMAPKLLGPHFSDDEGAEGVDFAVEYEHRSSDKFDRLEVIDCFVKSIKTPPHKVNLRAPRKTIIVQLTRNVCGTCVVDNYKEMNKFNIKTCAEIPEDEEAAPAPPSAEAKPAAEEAKAEEGKKEPEGQDKEEGQAEGKQSGKKNKKQK